MRYINPNAWTDEETDRLIERLEAGETHRSIASSFEGRSYKSVINKIGNLRHGFGESCSAFARASRNLENAILDAQVSFANRAGMTLEQAQQFLMGGKYAPPIPGTERHLKTCAVERMAA